MKKLFAMLLCALAFLASPVWAQSAASAPASAVSPAVNEAQARLALIKLMLQDGLLSERLADEAKAKYVDPTQLTAVVGQAAQAQSTEPSIWERLFTWSNMFKLIGLLFLLVAFWGTIRNIIRGLWHLFEQVPAAVYQAVAGAVTVTGTLHPELYWASQALYVALFCSFANLAIGGWVLSAYPKVAQALARLFNLGIPVASVASFWGMLYFGALALAYNSAVFGFFAAVCLSGVFSFGMYYSMGTLWLHFRENAQAAVVFGHLVVLCAYAVLKVQGVLPAQAALFSAGLEYYCTIALGVGLLVGASPFTRGPVGLYFLVAVAATMAGMFGYAFYDLTVIGSILLCFAGLLLLEWTAYLGFQGGVIIGCAMVGAFLYGLAMLIEHYGRYIVLTMA